MNEPVMLTSQQGTYYGTVKAFVMVNMIDKTKKPKYKTLIVDGDINLHVKAGDVITSVNEAVGGS